MSKAIRDYFGFALFLQVIGPKDSHHFLDQSDSKLKPFATWTPAFSRASGSLLVFTSSSPGDIVLTMTGCCDCIGFGFPTLIRTLQLHQLIHIEHNAYILRHCSLKIV